ncbi:MAG: class I SAM-dependent methyltransferase [Clostridiales bacterium]|nr:class I SAM-dependent methyltransferase [Clostridiales bacterium]
MMNEKKEHIKLSGRMSALAALVTPGHRLADVGCDHGYIPIYLCQTDIIPSAIAMDVRPGPLARAGTNIAAYGLQERIRTRLSDGLRELGEDEADTVLIAGMGGFLMRRILCEKDAVPGSVSELVLQPQSDIAGVRRCVRELGFVIADEDMVEEDGKFYPMMKAFRSREAQKDGSRDPVSDARESDGLKSVPDAWGRADREQETTDPEKLQMQIRCEDAFGPVLLRKRHPVLRRWLEKEKRTAERILHRLDEECEGRMRDDRLLARRDEISDWLDLLICAERCYRLS